jgi:hypothetical protein
MPEFTLFGTEGCHLCEEASLLIAEAGIDFKSAEIMDNQEWLDKYSLSIPVLRHIGSGQELAWPFDTQRLQAFNTPHLV